MMSLETTAITRVRTKLLSDTHIKKISSADDFLLRGEDDADDDFDMGLHARVNALLRAEDMEVEDEEEEQEDDDDDDHIVVLSPNEGLWEIPCIVSVLLKYYTGTSL